MKDLLKYFHDSIQTVEDVEQLKKKILELAVRGKLVKQDPNDEPASVLLERIKEEKERLIREKKIRKMKALPPISPDDTPDELPKGWEWVRLGQIGQIVGGGTPKTKNPEFWVEPGEGVPWITPADIGSDEVSFISRGKRDISELGLLKSSATLMPKGTVLLSSRAPIGYVAIAENDISTNQGFKSIVPYIINMNKYIFYYLKLIGRKLNEIASGTTFKEISGAEISVQLFPLPPLNEQMRIVSKVDELMEICNQLINDIRQKEEVSSSFNQSVFTRIQNPLNPNPLKDVHFTIEHMNDLLQTKEDVGLFRNSVLSLATQGKLVPQDPTDEPASVLLERIQKEKEQLVKEKKIKKFKPLPPMTSGEIPYELPESWVWVRLADISAQITDGTHHTPNYIEKGIPFLSVKDITKGYIDFTNVKYISEEEHQDLIKRCQPEFMDILLTKVGTTGIARVIDVNKEFSIFVSLALIKLINNKIDPYFLESVINSPLVKKQSEQGTEGVGNKNLVLKKIRRFIIPLPPLNEQKRIVARLDGLMAMCDQLEQQIEQSNKDRGVLTQTTI